ncbi:iron-siderophore ABC transporter substrate-binding protein [Kineosporia succinea]|uniref:Iron complex transport system substrate-binding protein n=1 Tax=Kineosporia succinea TaxID=84632 RepID=A0ABT9P5C0_9ACTN|nr:iron-siderophore ABC transporter substrate-binding protein [Kineosporia succinea]MDP9827893.1 iron complex transport system substrate-binding protein [Kineosporia succinea]
MFSRRRLMTGAVTAAAALVLAACGGGSDSEAGSSTSETSSASGASFPITVKHALGETVVEKKPERVATVQWANHEVPLALGVVPVGLAKANFGDADGDGYLPWVKDKLTELKSDTTPVLFDETDGIDFEAVADTQPDLILATYSGMTAEDYKTLSEIAPTVAYPNGPWETSWRDMIKLSSQAMGQATQGDELIASIESQMKDAAAKYPQIAGKKTMFLTHVDTADLSKVSFYTDKDTRAQFFTDLGMGTPGSIADASAQTDEFSQEVSAETVDTFDDVEIIVTYGDDKLLKQLKDDPILSKMPAVASGAIVALDGTSEVGTAANPTPLAISYVLDDYVKMLADAADKVDAAQ